MCSVSLERAGGRQKRQVRDLPWHTATTAAEGKHHMTDHPDSTIRPEQVSQFDLPAARAELGWTQDELADRLGVTARTIRTWERTGRVPRTRRPAITRAFTSPTGVDLEHVDTLELLHELARRLRTPNS